MTARTEGIGTPRLMEQLSMLVEGPVTICFSPPPAGDYIRWRVYDGYQDSSKGTLGEGPTVWEALNSAFNAVIGRTFRG